MIDIRKIGGRMGNQMFQFAYIYGQMRRGAVPDIYVQDYRWFDEFKDEIKQLYGEGIGEQIDMVAIHVRRAGNPINPNEPEYCKNPYYASVSETEYYERAMAQFPESDFIVFSDDIEWCKKQPMFANCEFSEGKTELEDLNLMAACVGHIIANSSFSYWGAYLSPYTKKVVAPIEWYADGNQGRTVCPPEWIRV